MICPECQAQGKKSCVFIGTATITMVSHQPFYDEAGEFHNHDPNLHRTSYSCSNGHSWVESRQSKCPSCNYGVEEGEAR